MERGGASRMGIGASTFGWGDFADEREERAFRAYHFDSAARQTIVTVGLTSVLVWMSARNDILLGGGPDVVARNLAARGLHTLVSLVLVGVALRSRSSEVLQRTTMVWVLVTVLAKSLVIASRPPTYFTHVTTDVIFLLIPAIALPISFRRQMFSMLALASSDALIHVFFKTGIEGPLLVSLVSSYFFSLSLGAAAAYRIQTMLHREYRMLRAETELRESLAEAVTEVRTLRGILPICSGCHDIRDERGEWHEVERYVHEHTHVNFSHGLCPKCVRKLYPDIADEVLAAARREKVG